MTLSEFLGRGGIRALLAYLAIWGGATAYLAAMGRDWIFPIFSLATFGGALGGLIWLLTRRTEAPAVPVARPRAESLALLVYVVLYTVLLLSVGLAAINDAFIWGRAHQLAILGYKLPIHVLFPAALVLLFGSRLRPLFDSGIGRRGFWPALVVLSGVLFALFAVVSSALKNIGALNLGPVVAFAWVLATWAWVSIEAGLYEEFLFRACLQSRLTAWLQSPATAIFITSVLFGLAHWPGLYLRDGPHVDSWSTDPFQVAAFAIANLSPLSVALGLLWARTRSLLLVAIVHGAFDALPRTAEFVRIWG